MQASPAPKPKYIQWNELNSVGLKELDEEHQHLVELINILFDLVSQASGPENLSFARRTLDRLVIYTEVHFDHEEAILASAEYPDLATHRGVHGALRERMLRLREQFGRSPTDAEGREILRFLRDWWTSHINRTDAAYAPYVGGHSGTLMTSCVEPGPDSAH